MNFHIFSCILWGQITIEIYLCPVLLDVCEDRMDPTTSRPGLQIYDYATWQFWFLPTFKFVSFVDVFWQLWVESPDCWASEGWSVPWCWNKKSWQLIIQKVRNHPRVFGKHCYKKVVGAGTKKLATILKFLASTATNKQGSSPSWCWTKMLATILKFLTSTDCSK